MKVGIEKMGFGGSGIGHLEDGRVVFVKKTVPADIVDIKISLQKKDFAFGTVEKVIESSKDRIEPDCPYFYQCGGCEHQNISYPNQLAIKEQLVKESLQRQKLEVDVLPIIAGSNKQLYYRNSIRFMFELDNNNQIHIARHAHPDENKLVKVEACLLQSKKSNEIALSITDFINKNVFHKKSFWQLKIREGKRTNEIMVELITSDHDLPGEKGIVEAIKNIDGVKSIYHTIAPAKSLLKLKRRLIFGSPVIFEKIGRYTFQISPESFFQTNSEGVETLYEKIKEFADVRIGDEVVDLFCGTGSIGIYLSTLAKKVTGIEVVPQAIRDANDNAKINKIKNIELICANANDLSIEQYDNHIIIVDPPRAGLDKKLIEQISNTKFRRLIYVSCNPATFARDLKYLGIVGIKAKRIQPIDMFPQTHHTEIVAELYR